MLNKNLFWLLLLFITVVKAQEFTQTIKGHVFDNASQEPIPYATVAILNVQPIIGTTTDIEGNFILEDIPVGRYNIEVSFLGYEPLIIPEIVVTSAKEVNLTIELTESPYALDEVIIRPKTRKEKPINKMATVSARMLSVEEASRYAGGFDDPARLASSFPGVATSNVGNNAIIVRGNAPKYLQWKIEGIEIPNPNHFANLSAFGGGGLTALSSNLLANSDFLTGAFPAEYNNALSGVFDIKMRNGNSVDHEHSIEAGLIGIDLTSEGPLGKKEKGASYLANYRYSTLGLISPLLPDDSGDINYQDISFKLNLPTKKAGLFSVWGIGLVDNSETLPEKDLNNQVYYEDIEQQDVSQYMGAFGINNRLSLKNSAYLNTTISTSTNGISLKTDRLNSQSQLQPENEINNNHYNIIFKSYLNKKFSTKHTHRTGITYRGLAYHIDLKERDENTNTLNTIASENGFSSLVSLYSQSSLSFKKWKLNLGINAQLFSLNNSISIEPRLGTSHQINENNAVSFGYGLHSRIEPLNIYFARTIDINNVQANRELKLSKAHHFVLAYDWNISKNLHLKVEPYFQYLFDIPIVTNTTTSLINLEQDWFITDRYINAGKGQNYGIDITLEQYMNNGFYYLISGSIFDSKYKTDTNEWFNTRFNKSFLITALAGKEFRFGKSKQSLLGINIRASVQGGNRYSPIDNQASILQSDVVYNDANPFTQQAKTAFLTDFTINYEWNKQKSTQRLSLKVLNATNFEEFQGHRFNLQTNTVDKFKEAIIIPNISYKIAF
ncbi:TonB-dependent receptor [Aquimarina litoralis]|uniref:TonB-dependent receptor n=1 Tax=Aquimarina litoralis TaxID=584605 RepID=UPI001C57019C|nr:TonB-dependent receptor [Aquimarina litoralis]MBW1298434.1 prevent-host-death protein [Aquimarina litoralis]